MVKRILGVLAALTATAVAHPPPYDPPDDSIEPVIVDHEEDSPSFNMFGFDLAAGALPLDGVATTALSIGLMVEHPVFAKTRVFGEYDWLWLQRRELRTAAAGMSPQPEEHGSGHRASVGLRRELKAKGSGRARMFVDGELGTSVALVNDNMTGVTVAPAVFTGLRLGYDIYSRDDDSPSRTWETCVIVRAVGMRDGIGFTLGLGMFWGN